MHIDNLTTPLFSRRPKLLVDASVETRLISQGGEGVRVGQFLIYWAFLAFLASIFSRRRLAASGPDSVSRQ